MLGLATLGTGIDPPAGDALVNSRKCRVDRESVGSAAAFADHLRVVWLTPAMDPLFNGPASERRRFLDRLVLAVDAQHSSRVAALERSLRSRNRLLEDSPSDSHWLDAIEHETAEVAVAVAAARAETVKRLSAALDASRNQAPQFPQAQILLQGWMEELLPDHRAIEIEDQYRARLKENRARDAAAGRTLDGPHLSDLAVSHGRGGLRNRRNTVTARQRGPARHRAPQHARPPGRVRHRDRRLARSRSSKLAGLAPELRGWSA